MSSILVPTLEPFRFDCSGGGGGGGGGGAADSSSLHRRTIAKISDKDQQQQQHCPAPKAGGSRKSQKSTASAVASITLKPRRSLPAMVSMISRKRKTPSKSPELQAEPRQLFSQSCPSKISSSRSRVGIILKGTSLCVGTMPPQSKRCKHACSMNNVTPSPNTHPIVPRGVIDIDSIIPSCCLQSSSSSLSRCRNKCSHQSNTNSAPSLTLSYLSTYGKDYCRVLRQLEDEQGNELQEYHVFLPNSTQRHLTDNMRTDTVSWISRASSDLRLRDKTFHAAVLLLDRTIAHRPNIERNVINRIGLVCLFLSAKLNENDDNNPYRPPHPRDFLGVAPVCMTVKEVIDMESDVCNWLGFRLHTVTPLCFLHRFLHASAPKTHHEDQAQPQLEERHSLLECMVLYLLELSTLKSHLVGLKPDMLAAAALYLARATLNLRVGIDENCAPQDVDSEFWNYTLEYYTNYTAEELEETVMRIRDVQEEAYWNPKWHVFEKFSGFEYCQVSSIPVLHEYDLGFF